MDIYKYNPNDWKKPHRATPSYETLWTERVLPNRDEAVKYLNQTTGFYLQAQDWALIGKLRPAE